MLTLVSLGKTPISYNRFTKKSSRQKGERKMETTMQEKLIQFILNLTNEECDMIVSHLMQDDTK